MIYWGNTEEDLDMTNRYGIKSFGGMLRLQTTHTFRNQTTKTTTHTFVYPLK